MRTVRYSVALSICLAGLAAPVGAATFTVTNTADAGVNSLRWAIGQANGAAGADTIAFNIGGGGVKTIALASALPTLSTTINLDATTQPGYVSTPVVVLNGASAGAGVSGLTITGANGTVRGLAVINFATHGILISGGAGGVDIVACHIGVDTVGNWPQPNGHSGIWIAGIPNNVVGPGNVISGNAVDGVRLDLAAATGNVIKGNKIGVSLDGLGALANGFNGIVITAASNNLIGGSTAADLNVISGNAKNGIGIAGGATGNRMERNYIGLGGDGLAEVPNNEDGVLIIDSPGNSVGGALAASFNVIGENLDAGIEIRGAAAVGNIVQRNFIGTDAGGTQDRRNNNLGVHINAAPNSVIGSGAWGSGGNLISNNGGGVQIIGASATGTLIQGNRFGLNGAGTALMRNLSFDVEVRDGAGGTTIGMPGAGNVIAGATYGGVNIQDSDANLVQSNYIGTDASGNIASGGGGGVSIYRNASNNVVGGANVNQRNIIAGGYGVTVGTDLLNTGNRVEGNWIGVAANGTALGNQSTGIAVYGPSTVIKNNVVSNNSYSGIYAAADSITIVGNLIGTNPAGTAAMGNGEDGVRISYVNNLMLGGTTAADRNIISANGQDGIDLENGSDEIRYVYGNYIGTDIGGTLDLGNAGDGVHVTGSIFGTGNDVIGGSAAGQGNLISGNTGNGVHIESAGADAVTVRGNRIGTQANGSSALGNGGHGILITESAGNNSIGGTAAGQGNIIRSNGGDGIYVAASTGNDIQGNSVFGNSGLGIDLGTNGVTANDVGDADSGANNLQNYPALTVAYTDGTTLRINGSFNSSASLQHRIEFFASSSCDASGNGEGSSYVGAANVTTNASGNATIAATFASAVAVGQFITATATSSGAGSETSEFSQCEPLVAQPVAPTVGNNGPLCNGQTLALTASTIAGASYAWTGPNGFTSTAQNPTLPAASSAASGTYSVIATVAGAPSNAATTAATVNNCTLSINNPAAITEGNSGTTPVTFTVSLTPTSNQALTVLWATANGTAVAPGDYAAGSGTLTIPANSASATITRSVVGDTLDEPNETFVINLSNASAGAIGDAQGQATINDDDNAPTVSIANRSCTEGNSGPSACAFTISLSAASGRLVGGTYATANGGATPASAGSDYTAVAATAWSITAGQSSTTVNVNILGDTVDEANETFLVNLAGLSNAAATGNDLQATGTISDDDAANGQLRMTECVAEISELVANIQITVERVGGSNGAIGVSYATANGSALAGSDYTTSSGSLSWTNADVTLRTITVPLLNNAARENREDFDVNLSAPTGGASLVAPSSTQIWILDGQDQIFEDGFGDLPPCP